MAIPANGNPDKKSLKSGTTYNQSVKLRDPGGSNANRPNPGTPFRNPDPKSRILNKAFDKASR